METLKIQKRAAQEIACWKVAVDQLTPNTVISVDPGITAVLKIDGATKIMTGADKVVNSLMNPGKGTKLFGGNKPYANVEVYAVDQSSEFFAEWGLAGNMAIPSYDYDNDLNCNVVAFGEYFYKVENFVNFIGTFSFENGVVTRDDIREFLRAETAGVIKGFLTSELSAYGLRECQTKLPSFSEDIKEMINKHLDSKGLVVYNFVILKLSYDPKHLAKIGVIDDAKLDVRVKQINNMGRKDDISVRKDDVDVDISLIKAKGEAGRGGAPAAPAAPVTPADNGRVIICPRCGERNVNSNYCSKCGEKLNK